VAVAAVIIDELSWLCCWSAEFEDTSNDICVKILFLVTESRLFRILKLMDDCLALFILLWGAPAGGKPSRSRLTVFSTGL